MVLCGTIGVEFWFCLGGSYLVTLRGVQGKFLKLGALKLHFQHSGNTFREIFYILKTTFY